MSLAEFQKATSELIASPELCRLLQRDPSAVLGRYDLSSRDQRRLVDLVRQRGMSVNCTLYRFNRITPLYTLLPLTNFVLGERFISEAELFWNSFTDSDPRFRQEIDRFGEFLGQRLQDGQLENELLAEVLGYELAANELKFSQRQQILAELSQRGTEMSLRAPLQIHPLVRLVLFQHEPTELLRLLKERSPVPATLAEGEYWVLLDVLNDELQARKIDPHVGRLLGAISAGEDTDLTEEDVEALLEERMIVRSF